MIRIAVCDDEEYVCHELEKIIRDYAGKQNLAVEIDIFISGEKFIEFIEKNVYYDIAFLDIELKGTNGIEVGSYLRNVKKNDNTQVIYISSKQKYAMSLFKIRPLDFLIKPITEQQVIAVYEKAVELIDRGNLVFEFHVGHTYYRVLYKDIVYFESNGRKMNIILSDGQGGYQKKECYEQIKNIVEDVPCLDFIQIHKSYLINYTYVLQYSYEQVQMADGRTLSISRTYQKQVGEKLLMRKKRNG